MSVSYGWEKPQGITNKDLLRAYMKGRMDEKNEADRIIKKQFFDNVEKAKGIGEHLYQEIIDNQQIIPVMLYLKPESLTVFKYLFIFKLEDYLSDKLFEVYHILRRKKQEVSNDTFRILFQNTPNTDHLNHECLMADGFFFRYEPKAP